jgi:hypothetical protein
MSDRLFQLEQELQRLRAQAQSGLSEAQSYEDAPQTNRLLALEQSLTLPEETENQATATYTESLSQSEYSAPFELPFKEELKLPTKSYRLKGGSASSRVNQALEEYNTSGRADTEAAQSKLTALDLLLNEVSERKGDEVARLREAIQLERKRVESIERKNMIMTRYAIQEPKIGFRYDSRPIELALKEGYIAVNPEEAAITENGENQDMVGTAHNFVGSRNYEGYAKKNAHSETKAKWKKDKGTTFYWTAVIIRKGGMTYEWLLDQIPNEADRARVRTLVLQRIAGNPLEDKELKHITDKHGVSRNIGTTEIVTDKIAPNDILGYWEIFKPNSDLPPTVTWKNLKDVNSVEGNRDIPREDWTRFSQFKETGGSIVPSTFV